MNGFLLFAFFLIIIVIIIVYIIKFYNNFQMVRQGIRSSLKNIDTVLDQRVNLITKANTIAQNYGVHEKLTNIALSNNTADTFAKSEQAVANLNAIGQAYPDLKADRGYIELMTQLKDVEYHLQKKREQYNNLVGNYNGKILQFPAVVFASLLGFHEVAFLELNTGNVTVDIKSQEVNENEMLNNVVGGVAAKKQNISNANANAAGYDIIHCPKCNTANVKDSKFCTECGFNISNN